MNKSYYNITLDIKSIQSQITLPVKQGDTSRGVKISLVDGGKPYTISENCFATFKGEKSDGTEVGNNCIIKNNRIVYDITEQTVTSPGIVACEVSLYDTDKGLITSPRFTLIVDSRAVGSDKYKSSSEYTSLEGYLSEVRAAEEERQEVFDHWQKIIRIVDSPKLWELGAGYYKVTTGYYVTEAEFINISNENAEQAIYIHILLKYSGYAFYIRTAYEFADEDVSSTGICPTYEWGVTNGTTLDKGFFQNQSDIVESYKDIEENPNSKTRYPSVSAMTNYIRTQIAYMESVKNRVDAITDNNKAEGGYYPSTKAVYNYINSVINSIENTIGNVTRLSQSDFVNGSFEKDTGIVNSEYWVIMPNSIKVSVGDKITIEPGNNLKVWWRILNNQDLSIANNFKNGGTTTEKIEYVSEFDGYFNVQVGKIDGTKITPVDYNCSIIVDASRINSIEQDAEDIKESVNNKQDILVSGESIKTINGESILGSGDIEIKNGDSTVAKTTDGLFSKHTPFTNIIDDCQDVSKWTITNTSSDIVSVDENSYVLGSLSLHSNKEMRSTKYTYDLTKNYLVLKLKVNSIATGSRLFLSVGNTSAPNIRVMYELARGTAWTTPEGWQEIVISTSNYYGGSVDAIDFSNIDDLYFMAQTVSGAGTPEVDWNLQYVGTRPKTTNKGIVTFTFDDGWDSQYTGAKLLGEKGITSTIFSIKDAVGKNNYLTLNDYKSLVELYGTDIEVHGDPSYDKWNEEDLKIHWSESQKFIRDNKLGNGKHMAYPNGMFPENVVELAKEYFDSCRTITPFLPVESLPVADRFRIRAVSSIGASVVTPNKVKEYIDRVAKDGGWLILVLHKIGNTTGDSMYCSETDLSLIADYAIESGVDIMNYAEVMDRFYADLSPEKDVVTSSGTNIDLVTEFEGVDSNYEENQAFNANAVVEALTMYAEILEAYEERISELEKLL